MAQLKIPASDFNLTSTWNCKYYIELSGANFEYETYCCIQSEATTAKTTVSFPLTLPANAKINSARVHSTWSGSLHGMAIQHVDGKVPTDGFVTIANPAANAASVAVEFAFKAIRDNYESHDAAASTAHKTANHSSVATVKDVYLLIDYEIALSACTAPSGVTLARSTSTGEKVTLSWNAGAGGAGNAASYYEIARKESTDGSTWGDMQTVTTTTGLSCSVAPPVPYGSYYRFYVRLVGTAGTSYASAWVLCKNSLQKVRPALVSYTDNPVEAGTTRIKAVHILELRTNVNRLRQGLGLAAYSFTECRAGHTSLARWRAHILELRAAIDEMAPTHEAWIAIPTNRPTAAVVQQLRRVVAKV